VTSATRRTILLYSAVMIAVLAVTSPAVGLFVIPISFLLKNKLHMSANALATFTLWAGLPAYFAFVFGIVRDYWSPLKLGDRGYFILFGALAAALGLGFCLIGASQAMLLGYAMAATLIYLFLWGAWNGLSATIGQRHAMSGEMSAVWNFVGTIFYAVALWGGGLLSGYLETLSTQGALRVLFLVAAAIMTLIALLGLWKPRAVFDGLDGVRTGRRDVLADAVRLVRHRPIYPALLIWCLWNFSPGGQTVLQYHLSDQLHGTDADWGAYNAIFFAASLPAFLIFGFLSTRLSLGVLLWVGALCGLPQMLPLLFIHTPQGVMVAAVFVGLLGGIATGAYMDLLIRACPKDLEGTLMMMAWSLYAVSVNFGNLWGTSLYEHYGFDTCILVTTAVYAAILPLVLLVPKSVTVAKDEGVG
jgi:MFS family permease